jgi:hypothetical protein
MDDEGGGGGGWWDDCSPTTAGESTWSGNVNDEDEKRRYKRCFFASSNALKKEWTSNMSFMIAQWIEIFIFFFMYVMSYVYVCVQNHIFNRFEYRDYLTFIDCLMFNLYECISTVMQCLYCVRFFINPTIGHCLNVL